MKNKNKKSKKKKVKAFKNLGNYFAVFIIAFILGIVYSINILHFVPANNLEKEEVNTIETNE